MVGGPAVRRLSKNLGCKGQASVLHQAQARCFVGILSVLRREFIPLSCCKCTDADGPDIMEKSLVSVERGRARKRANHLLAQLIDILLHIGVKTFPRLCPQTPGIYMVRNLWRWFLRIVQLREKLLR